MKFSKEEWRLVYGYWATVHKNAVLVSADTVAPGTLVVAYLPDPADQNNVLHNPNEDYWPFIVVRQAKRHVRVAGVSPSHGDHVPLTLPCKTKVAVLNYYQPREL
jgi:hypothetical protein